MDAEEFLNLFDSYWFHQQIFFTKKPSPPPPPPLQNPPLKIEIESPKPEISHDLPSSHHVRSLSDQLLVSSKIISVLDSESPKSVLFSHKLQTILSGKQSSYEEETSTIINTHKKEEEEIKTPIISSKKSMFMKGSSNKRRNRGSSKSLSDLEFDELKGFMDLGFVFSEEDKNSSTLVSIIPGLQRLNGGDEKSCSSTTIEIVDDDKKQGLISRPYLSEAWKIMGQRKEEKFSYTYPPPLMMMMNWRVPSSLGNEVDMKDQLKCWAHSVASTVR